jgi:hypothetical protein
MRRKQFNNVFRTRDSPQKGRQKSTINVAKMNSCWARGPDPPPPIPGSTGIFYFPPFPNAPSDPADARSKFKTSRLQRDRRRRVELFAEPHFIFRSANAI